jgi:L-threonylcarbamoyladenylate synthase
VQRIPLAEANQTQIVRQAAAVLQAGGLVLYPTETVYGVAVDATNPEAVGKLLQYKNRPAGKAIAILVRDQEQAEEYVQLNDTARNLYATFLPGPLTVVSKSLGRADARLESELGTLGVRISSHPLAQALASAMERPITATSANASGKARPYSIDQVLVGLSDRQKALVDLALDAGTLPRNDPSTVIDTTTQVQSVIRTGALTDQIIPPVITTSVEETIRFARDFAASVAYQVREGPVALVLEGEMGAGKTHFAKGVAEAFAVQEPVTSPTYVVMKEYRGTHQNEAVPIYHLDCWRLEQASFADFFPGGVLPQRGVVMIEWAVPLERELSQATEQGAAYRINLESEGGPDSPRRTIQVARL